jgi:hypothetical protein
MSADRGAAGTLGALDPAGSDDDRLVSLADGVAWTVGPVG